MFNEARINFIFTQNAFNKNIQFTQTNSLYANICNTQSHRTASTLYNYRTQSLKPNPFHLHDPLTRGSAPGPCRDLGISSAEHCIERTPLIAKAAIVCLNDHSVESNQNVESKTKNVETGREETEEECCGVQKKILNIDPDTYTIECKEPAELHLNTNTLGLAWAN